MRFTLSLAGFLAASVVLMEIVSPGFPLLTARVIGLSAGRLASAGVLLLAFVGCVLVGWLAGRRYGWKSGYAMGRRDGRWLAFVRGQKQ